MFKQNVYFVVIVHSKSWSKPVV